MMTWVTPTWWPRLFSSSLLLLLLVVLLEQVSSEATLEFHAEPTSRLAKASEGRASFRCTAFPPAAELRWRFAGRPLPRDAAARAANHKLSVALEGGRRWEGGAFQCEARFKGLALVSAPAKLIVAVLEQFHARPDVHIAVFRGNTAVIPCDPPYSVPTVVTEFLFNGSLISKSTDNVRMMPSGDLQILEASTDDAGMYQCIAYNPFLSEKATDKRRVILHVEEPSAPSPPTFIKSPRARLSVALGSNVTLECVVNAYPSPVVTWRRQDGHLPKSRHEQIGGNLHIFGVRRTDEGLYYCESNSSSGGFISTSSALEVRETPQIFKKPKSAVVEIGHNLTLHCGARGHPKPSLTWIHNGRTIMTDEDGKNKGSLLVIENATSKNAGYYQCFASNDLGSVYANALIKVLSSNSSHNEDYGANDDDYDDHGGNTPSFHRKKDKGFKKDRNDDQGGDFDQSYVKRNHKKKKSKGVKLVPPTRPEVSRLTDTSVMVRWGVPRNDGLPILFFKVQYKEVGKRNGHWVTIDEDIAAHIHSYAVTSLRPGGKYRFRIAAVYSNNDNKLGPNSAKYVLSKDPLMKKPTTGPLITQAEAASPSAITLYWEYDDLPSVPIDGFFIYYRSADTAGDYLKVTVLGASTRSHILSHLMPDSGYDIKMQGFNAAGTSDFSNIFTCKTKPSEILSSTRHRNRNEEVAPVSITEPVSSKNEDRHFVLYVVLGVVGFVLFVAVSVFLALCSRQRQNRHERSNGDPIGKIGNGHIVTNGCYASVPTKVNINVNPLSHIDAEDCDKPEEFESMVSNNNEIIRLQTFSITNEPQRDPLSTTESCMTEEEPEPVIKPSDSANPTELPQNV